jgi:DNA-binding MarR family transcriptional regulator
MAVTQPAGAGPGGAGGAGPRRSGREPRWLDAEERAAWLSILRVTSTLPAALDIQLERDEGLNYFEYIVLAMLSEQPGLVLRMSQLAALSNASPSRLSHVARRLEERGLMRREPDPQDGRATNAVLTDAGVAKVRRAAPGHVAEVRSLVLDALSLAQLRQVRAANDAILARIDPTASTQPITPWPDRAAALGNKEDQ